RIEINCEREKADRGCVPLSDIEVTFSEPVEKNYADNIFITDESGNRLLPEKTDEHLEIISSVQFRKPFRAEHTYTLHIPQDIKDINGRSPANLGKFPLRFKTDRMPPLAKFAADFGIVEMINGEGVLPLTVRGLKNDLNIKSFGLDGGTYKRESVKKKGIFARIWEFIRSLFARGSSKTADSESERKYILSDIKIKNLRISDFTPGKMFEFINSVRYRDHSKAVFDENNFSYEVSKFPDISDLEDATVLGIPIKSYGLYFFEVESSILGDFLVSDEDKKKGSKKAYVHSVALVTDLAVTFKRGKKNSLVLVTRLSDASVVSGAEIKGYDCRGKEYFSGYTDENGVYVAEQALPEDYMLPECSHDGYWDSDYKLLNRGIIVTARYKNDFSFVSSAWDKGIEPYRYNIYEYFYSSDYVVHSVLSRNLLRAGETLHIKGYFRKKTLKNIFLASSEEMPRKVRIEHLGTQKVWEYDIRWSDNGNMYFKWDVPKDAHTGHYKIWYFDCPSDSTSGKCNFESETFLVEEFKVPLIKAELLIKDSDKKEEVNVEGVFSYLMGAPANDLPVQLRYKISDDYTLSEPGYPEHHFLKGKITPGIQKNGRYYEEGENSEEREIQSSEENITEKRGVWKTVSLRTDEYGRFSSKLKAGRSADGRPRTLNLEAGYTDPNGYFNTVTKSKTLYTSPFVIGISAKSNKKEKVISADVVVLDINRKPVRGEKVLMKLYKNINYVHRKKILGGYYSYEYIREIKPLSEFCSAVTDSDGRAYCSKKIEKGGAYIIEAETGDSSRGVSFTSAPAYLYDYGSDEWFDYSSDSDRTDIFPDKTEYKVNETARIKVITPFEKSTALVTVERGGILDYFITEVDAKRPIVELKIKPEYSPNAFVSVVLIRGRISSPPPTFIADLAKPSFRMGIAEISVDKEKYRLDVKIRTDRKKYRVREKVKGSVEIRGAGTESPDLMLFVVDEGLLNLLENPTYNILDKMVKEDGLGVHTSTGLTQVVGRRHFGKKAFSQGGGGGRIVTREMFDTLVYFADSLRVSGNRADFEFVLNDSITSFRIVAIASTTEKFGSGFANIESTKELFINSSLPYFAREGDSFDAEFVVKNVSDKNYNLRITGEISFIRNGEEKRKDKLGPVEVELKSGGNQKISFPVRIPWIADEGRYRIDIMANGVAVDSITVKQKITEAIPLRVVQSVFKRFSGKSEENYGEFERKDIHRRINVSFMKDLGETGRQLINYSGFMLACLEQKTSYAVVADDREFFGKLMNEINLYLDENGLLKYYPSSREGSPMLTAYVLEITRLNGFELPDYVVLRTTDALKDFVMGKIYRRNVYMESTQNAEKIFALSVLRAYNKYGVEGLAEVLKPDLSLLSLSSIIDVANAKGQNVNLRNAIMSFFTEKSGAYFLNSDIKNNYWWLMRSEDEAFAKTLIYLIQNNADDTTLGKMANGLINRFEKRGYLNNTTSNAYAAVALRLFAKRFKTEFQKSLLNVSFKCNYYREDVNESFTNKSFLFDVEGGGGITGGERDTVCKENNADILSFNDRKNSYWVKTLLSEKAPLKEPVFKGFRIKKEYLDEKGQIKKTFRQSELVKVRITVESDSYYSNIVLIDPLLTGSQVTGRITQDSSQYSDYFLDYTYSDVRDGYIRTYYEYIYGNRIIFEYSVRLNTRGKFNLPPTRVELMYMPDVYGEIPNETIVVQ
ncbi:MAG: MG2 domain-containing protein, partial [Deltaproteobacteria bacterium]|nr:MG2 domain-containing protein [Deltaproteobacteria bacterium]